MRMGGVGTPQNPFKKTRKYLQHKHINQKAYSLYLLVEGQPSFFAQRSGVPSLRSRKSFRHMWPDGWIGGICEWVLG